jgi:hypothetical protein
MFFSFVLASVLVLASLVNAFAGEVVPAPEVAEASEFSSILNTQSTPATESNLTESNLTESNLTESNVTESNVVESTPSQEGLTQAMSGPFGRGDFNQDEKLDLADIDILSAQVKQGSSDEQFDLDHDGSVTEKDLAYWIMRLRHSFVGDADLDGEFDNQDVAAVLKAGTYESDKEVDATWATGDWNGDSKFDSSDLVLAFQQKGFGLGPRIPATRPKAVPEPVGLSILGIAMVFLLITYTLVHRKPV